MRVCKVKRERKRERDKANIIRIRMKNANEHIGFTFNNVFFVSIWLANNFDAHQKLTQKHHELVEKNGQNVCTHFETPVTMCTYRKC